MVLRNPDTRAGVCNGKPAFLINGTSRELQARILTGDNAGDTALIPHITLQPTDSDLELPLFLFLKMPINKAQDQSVSQVE